MFHEQIRLPKIDVGRPISHFHFPLVPWLHLPAHECLNSFLHLLICWSTNIQNHDQGSNISRDLKFPSASLMSCLRNCRQQMQQCLGSTDIVSHKRNSHLPACDHHTTVSNRKLQTAIGIEWVQMYQILSTYMYPQHNDAQPSHTVCNWPLQKRETIWKEGTCEKRILQEIVDWEKSSTLGHTEMSGLSTANVIQRQMGHKAQWSHLPASISQLLLLFCESSIAPTKKTYTVKVVGIPKNSINFSKVRIPSPFSYWSLGSGH